MQAVHQQAAHAPGAQQHQQQAPAPAAAAAGGAVAVMPGAATGNAETHSFVVSGTKFEVDRRYELIKPIGHGAYGVVV